jgi:hypothetical protein
MRLHQVLHEQQGTKLLQFVGIAFTLGEQYQVNHSVPPFPKVVINLNKRYDYRQV